MNEGLFGVTLRKSWSDIQPPGGVLPDGFWTVLLGNSNASLTATVNREVIIPFKLWYPHRIKALGISCTVVGTEACKVTLGIRPVMKDGWPAPQTVCQGEADCTSATGTGSKWCQMDADLPPGRYLACYMASGWTTTPPQFRQSTTGVNDVNTYPMELPRLNAFPVSVAVGLPGAGNQGWGVGFRFSSIGKLATFAARDWNFGTIMPALWIQGTPVLG